MATRWRKLHSRMNRSRAYTRRRHLTVRNIAMNRSAKSQANQILALRSRLNRMQQHIKPDVKKCGFPSTSFSLDSQMLSSSYQAYSYTLPALGAEDYQRVGDKIYARKCAWYINMEYYNTSDTGYHNSESAGTAVRVFVVQSKDAVGNSIPALADFLEYATYTGTEYTLRAVSPFKNGITSNWRVLYDNVFYLTTTKNQKVLKVKVKPGIIRFNSDGESHKVLLYICPAGLHNDANFTEYVHGSVGGKLVYTDY